MKKLFSVLFSIAFLLVFVSFFSQKSFALGSAESLCTVDNPCTVWHDPDPLGRWPAGYLVGGACNSSNTELWYCDFTTKATYQQRYGSGTGNFRSYCSCHSNTNYNVNKGEDYCNGGTTAPPTFTNTHGVGDCISNGNACSTTGTWDVAYTCSNGVTGTSKNESCTRTPSAPTKTCSGLTCGSFTDSCGNPQNCGTCNNTQTCSNTSGGTCTTTCTPSTGTCGGTDACSTTGSKDVTTCNGGLVTTAKEPCTLTPPDSCNKPTVPSLTCTTATPTTASFSWTKDANTTESLLYYCDKTKAAANNVSCTPGAHPSNKTDASEAAQAGWYFLPGNAASTSPTDLTGLIPGHEYTAFISAYNGNHVTSTLHAESADIYFTGGSCTSQPGLALVIGLDGIGTTGDQVNANWTVKTNTATINGKTVTNQVAGSNQDPKTLPREATLTLTDTTSNAVTIVKGNFTFATDGVNKGKYTGTIPYGTTVKAGTYKATVGVDGHLTKPVVPATITVVNTNTTVNIQGVVDLVTGNIDGNGTLDGSDYNLLLSCMNDSDFTNAVGPVACNANAAYKVRADLEDNGVIDKFDYNLFLRELK